MENIGKKYNDMLIRNFDASYLYWQIKDDALISEYLYAKKQLNETGTPELKKRLSPCTTRFGVSGKILRCQKRTHDIYILEQSQIALCPVIYGNW